MPGASLTLKEKMALAGRVRGSARLKQVAVLAGRMARIALRLQESKVNHLADEVMGVGSADLARLHGRGPGRRCAR